VKLKYYKYILENAKNIQEKQEEIFKLKSQIAQTNTQIRKEHPVSY